MTALRRLPVALLAALAVAGAAPARADDAADLRADTWRAAGITAGALLLSGIVDQAWKNDDCRICGSNPLDERARDALRWSHPEDAQRASDVVAKVAIPVLAAADAWRSTTSWGNAGRDAVVVAEAFALANLATSVAKGGFARLRPGLPDVPGQSSGAYHSLWSAHSSLAFSVVAAQATQDTMRGDPAAPWVWGIGLTLATSVAYLRVAGDAHWLTDVLAGAAVGTGFGVAVPLLEKRLVHGVTIAPAPGGIALRF
jgi:hypothetical protein